MKLTGGNTGHVRAGKRRDRSVLIDTIETFREVSRKIGTSFVGIDLSELICLKRVVTDAVCICRDMLGLICLDLFD